MKLINCAVLTLSLSLVSHAQKVEQAKVDAIFAAFARTDIPGCAVGASVNDAIVLSAAYGMADLEHGLALRPDSVFEAGSVSKQFTAAAILTLADQGRLKLDDPIQKYLPELPTWKTPVTIRHLINHTSGLRDWGSIEAIAGWPRTTRAYTQEHVLDIAAHQRELNYPAGAFYSYTNTGYNLQAIIVSRLTGKTFGEFTKEALFLPNGMDSTQWRDDFRRIVPNRAIAYDRRGSGFAMDMPFENAHGNGGLLTTVQDLLRWNQRPLSEAQLQRGKLTDGRTIGYAAGLMIRQWRGVNEIHHSGSTAGYRAWLGRFPDQKLSVAVLCNAAFANAPDLGHRVAALWLKDALRPEPAVTATTPAPGVYRSLRDHTTSSVEMRDGKLFLNGNPNDGKNLDFGHGQLRINAEIDGGEMFEKVDTWLPSRADLEAMTGTYSSDEAEVSLNVVLENGGLVIHRRPDTKIRLTPAYKDGFMSSLGSVRFLRDSSGRAKEMSIGQSRVWDLRLKRAPR